MKYIYGQPINQDLSNALRDNISVEDIADIAIKGGVSASTLRDVMYRRNSVTKNNEKAISMLIDRALKNSVASKGKFKQHIETLEIYIK